jgi:uncharacterized protein (TIGR02147 family)
MNHRLILTAELARRKTRNPNYSLRAFASSLNVSPTALSQVINGLRNFRPQVAQRVALSLGLTPLERQGFIRSASSSKSARPSKSKSRKTMQMELDCFELISEWYYFAILNLAKLNPRVAFCSQTIAARLGLSESETHKALQLLLSLNLIEVQQGELVRTASDINVPGGISSTAIRKYHRQNLERAITALDVIPVDERDFSSVILPFSKDHLADAAVIIGRMRNELCELCPEDQADRVYAINIQLFPQDSGKKL